MRRIALANNEAISRSLTVRMPGYDMPPPGEWTMELRRRAIATGAPDFVFSSAIGNLRIVAYDAPNKKVVLALLAPAQAVADLHDSYKADLVYVEGGLLPKTLGTFLFIFSRGVTHLDLTEPPPAYDDLASWAPIVDISGANAATVLSMVERGLPGPPGGVTDHGGLTGLNDDDHPNYLNNSRGDARYAPVAHQHAIADVAGLTEALTGATHHGPLAARDAFDNAGNGFLFFQTDDPEQRLIAYIKLSNTLADWSGPFIGSPPLGSVTVRQLRRALKAAGKFFEVDLAIPVTPGDDPYEAWIAGGERTRVGDTLYHAIGLIIGAPATAAAYAAALSITL